MSQRFTTYPVLVFVIGCFILFDAHGLNGQDYEISSIPANGFSPDGSRLAKQAKSTWTALSPFAFKGMEAIANSDFTKINPDKVGPAYAASARILRYAEDLELLKEPCAVDYYHRGKEINKAFLQIANKMLMTSAGRKIKSNAESVFQNQTRNRLKRIEKVAKLIQKGSINEAQNEYDELLYDVDTYLVWLPLNYRQQVSEEYREPTRFLYRESQKLRKEQAKESLSKALQAVNPSVDSLLSDVDNALVSVKQSGRATVAEQEFSAPEAILEICKTWQKTHVKLIRSQAIASLLQNVPPTVPIRDLLGTKLGKNDFKNTIKALNSSMTESIPKLIKSDLKRPGASIDKDLYLKYLTCFAELKGQLPEELMEACERELTAFESSNGKLAKEISNYKKATNDLLLWKSRVSKSMAKSAGEYNSASAMALGKPDAKLVPAINQGFHRGIMLATQPQASDEPEDAPD
ncbi:MAG: hypothetical protein AAF939_12315, partial [Planctomycetota bacterium]